MEKKPGPDHSAYCRALFWARIRGTLQPVLPWVAWKYLLIVLACFGTVVAIVEYRLTGLAREGRVVSENWHAENEAINRMNFAKIKADRTHPLWHSAGIPPPGPKNGRHRILVVGDSFVWGDGYANANDLWWRQLARELRYRGYYGVDVVAAGVSATSTQDHLHWFRSLTLLENLEPDLLVLGYVTNDPDMKDAEGRVYVKQLGRDGRIPSWRALDRTLGRVAPKLATQLKQQLTRKWESRLTDVYPYNEWELKLLESPNIDAYRGVIEELGEFVRSRGVPFFALTLPNYPNREKFEPRHRPIAPIFAAAGLPFHDILDDFVKAYPSIDEVLRWGINPANGHPGPVSTRFYAREAADILERDFPAILGPKTAPPQDLEPKINDWMPPAAAVRRVGPGDWELTYPESGAPALRLPLGKPHVLLAFAEPVAIRSVKLSGAMLKEIELHFAQVDATGVESREHQALGVRNGNSALWSLAGVPGKDRVNTLRLAAQLDGAAKEAGDRTLNVHIDFEDNPVRP